MSRPNWNDALKEKMESVNAVIIDAEESMKSRGCVRFAVAGPLSWDTYEGSWRILLGGKPLGSHKMDLRLEFAARVPEIEAAADEAMRTLLAKGGL